MDLYSSPALNGQGFRAEISTGCNSNALVFNEAEGLSAGMTMVCETVENCHENGPYRGQHLSRQVSLKPLGFHGFEENIPSENEGGPSLFSYCPLPETDTHGEALVSDHGDKDDARKSDVRRRAPTSTIVDPEDDFNAIRGAHHAERILGRPLNWLLTWNIPTIRDAAPQDRAPLWKAERDTLRAFFRRNKEAFTYVMNRASMDRQGSGEHAHLLLHCPKRLTHKFVGFVVKQWGSPAADVRPASRHWWRKRNGRLQSALNYCLQGVSWGRAHAKGRDYKNGGTIAGKRTSWSDDIGPKAIAAYEVSNGIVTAG